MKTIFKLFGGKMYDVTKDKDAQEYMNMRAKKLLNSMRNNRFTEICRHETYLFRSVVLPLVEPGAEFHDVRDYALDLIKSCEK